MKLLLDTTIIIDYLRGDEKAATYIQRLTSPMISIITEAEVYEGARDKKDLRRIEKTLASFTIIPVTPQICKVAIQILKQYRLSHGLLTLDALIAATAVTYNYSLVTSNVKHFRAIKELSVIPWPQKN